MPFDYITIIAGIYKLRHITISIRSSVSTDDDVLCQEVGGETVLLDLKNEFYFSLDAVGSRVWQLLAEYPLLQDVYNCLLEEYEVEPETLRNDLLELITELEKNSLVKVQPRAEATGAA